MEINELYLKTAFCCMACDSEIAEEEISLVKNLSLTNDFFDDLDINSLLIIYCKELKDQGPIFVSNYLQSLTNEPLSKEQELRVCQIAIKIILADKQIEYKEIAFFKKIRAKLSVSDDEIISDALIQKEFSITDPEILQGQTIECWLLPDIVDDSIFDWNLSLKNVRLEKI